MGAATGGRAGVRAAIPILVVVAMGLSLTGCETTAEKSAQLEQVAHRHAQVAEKGLTIAKQSAEVHVLDAVLVHSAEGAAAVVTLRNDSANALKDVPIAITVKDAQGSTVFQNNTPGLEAALTSLGSIAAHGEATWVDDQVPTTGVPASVTAIVGEPPIVNGAVPQIEAVGVHQSEESGSATVAGTVHNRSSVTQQALVVYAVARRAGRVVAAGRAILPEVAAGASIPFQAFLVGSGDGASLQAVAPATTFG
jgi:hypothetical protein